MILSVKQVWETLEPKDFPLPEFSHLKEVTDFTVNPNIRLTWDEIYIDDALGNPLRPDGQQEKDLENLQKSFATGVIINEDVPAVRKRNVTYGNSKPWELGYGFGRSLTLKGMGTSGWFFTPITATEDGWSYICQNENETPPKSTNTEKALALEYVKLVTKGSISNTEQAIRKRIGLVLPYRKKESRDRILSTVMELAGTPQLYATWNTTKFDLWQEDHSKADHKFVFKNKWDTNRDMFGIFEKEGSWSRAFWKALKNYQNYQAETYLIMHLGLPTETQSIEDKRKKQVEEHKLAKKMLKSCGMSKEAINCLVPIGFMPSVKGIDSWKEFVPFV